MISKSNDTSESRMCALCAQNFGCNDGDPGMLHVFVYEIYGVFNWFLLREQLHISK